MSLLARKNLDKRFDRMRPLSDFARPPRGWLRAIREALEMTTAQFGKRLQVSQSRISALEKAEMNESVTLASLRRAAEALDCTLVYALVPRQPLDATLMERARAVAEKKLSRIDHTMRLENQAIDVEELNSERERLARELAEHPRRLWDDA
jgi:predicted DNA-binding mobile mystery protein A